MKQKNRIKTIFGHNVKKYRERAGLSQNEFAEKLACYAKYVSEIETGKSFASSELMEDIVSVFNIPVSFLFEEADRAVGTELIEAEIDSETMKLAIKMKELLRRS